MRVYFIDGCFDGFHYGHVHALYQAKQLCDELILGTHSDMEMEIYKNPPLFNYHERVFMLQYCKYINNIVHNTPYITDIETLNQHGCQMFVHGEEQVFTKNNIDALKNIKDSGRYTTYNTTRGISTTNLLFRIYSYYHKKEFNTNLDYIYLSNILYNLKKDEENIDEESSVVVIHGTFDMFNSQYIRYILNIKAEYPSHKIICCVNEYDSNCIYNHLERSIILCGISIINKVISLHEYTQCCYKNKIDIHIPDEYENDIKDNIIFNIINSNKNLFIENKISREIDKYKKYKELDDLYLKSGKYFEILKQQYDILLQFLTITNFKENDLIVFDIDEVCLSNLMYINNFSYTHLYNNYDTFIYNFKNGLTPIIKECIPVFDFLHSKNIKYAFITGRRDYIRLLTEKNLKLVQLDKYIKLYTCPNNFKQPIKFYKTQCRQELSNNYNIIACIGDQISDLEGHYTGLPYLIFNPFYKTE